ncbi:hypothetical protein E2C01_096456 [Portunus trituberculatus]|uniref:Uncharacterized protein n=1 Tax=Portunus trituberculatus TaxID=210409 RepID=A0A5B7K720_PORTR|nr:hypothetical protein [Portunus trituberculatus]
MKEVYLGEDEMCLDRAEGRRGEERRGNEVRHSVEGGKSECQEAIGSRHQRQGEKGHREER